MWVHAVVTDPSGQDWYSQYSGNDWFEPFQYVESDDCVQFV
ncbi:hypothetical protein [Nocardia sp. NPDC052112]